MSAAPLVQIAAGDAPYGGGDAELRVRVGPPTRRAPADGGPPTRGADGQGEARIAVHTADPALAAAITERITAALAAAADELAAAAPPVDLATALAPVLVLRSRKALARRGAAVAGALAVVPVTERNARHLVELIGGIRAAGALGVQLVWDGAAPPRARVERHIFAALEAARARPLLPPVVLATEHRPAAALRILVAHRRMTER
ncbi:MAG TPA: hypothetical protein VNO30_08150 [Kofleriaceae bacterium]|nr:hypothetical protein [Kofleriaceae bacterium]